jgi:serine/threonine protein kinase
VPDSPAIDQVVSRYRIVQKIGSGGMGVVYKTEDTQLSRFVAIKFLPDDVTPAISKHSSLCAQARSAGRQHFRDA